MSALANSLRNALHEAGHDAVMAAAQEVKRLAIEGMPKGDPALDPNQAVEMAESVTIDIDRNRATVTVDTPYAAKQHEDQRLEHPRGGGPQFLSNAVKLVAAQYPALFAGKVRAQTQQVQRRA